jgi:O-antigen biosynthesis protein
MSLTQFERVPAASLDAPVHGFQVADRKTRGEDARLPRGMLRPRTHGKFLFVGDEKLWIRGVTYGTFKPDATGAEFPAQDVIERDFRAMAEAGLNSVRVYTAPPLRLMDAAAARGLRVMVGLPWEQHIAFLDEKYRAQRIVNEIRTSVQRLAGHPALLCYAVGNEIPASVVRWYGKGRVERFIGRLCAAAKSEDPGALVTYVNFPTTEYLDLPLLNFVSFNVYLESKDRLSSYLARLQNLAGERPLLMAEIGLDSGRNGEDSQAQSLHWQIATTFEAGCVGAFVFAWTDEWFRGGHDIADWDFGLVTRERRPKQALRAVSARFAECPFSVNADWPRISVVVCSCDGARTIEQTLAALQKLDYPDYEVIVIDDGSTDRTSTIAGSYPVKLIRTENRGLSAARNRGLEAATGEIVAYIDDDAYPDAHWLTYLGSMFLRSDHAGIGGPNIAPPHDGPVADCVANAPGGPVHVLLSDEIAEHIPGCNMAFRREKLMAIGGFDTQFRVAGDDVDVCWRLQERGWTIGFAPTAVVWHHRRNSIKGYFRQQRGYAKAEALLADKWPGKYNSAGHLAWRGRLYGRGIVEPLFSRCRIYHGVWNTAPFQSIYQPSPGSLSSLSLMPEWYFLLVLVGFLAALGSDWKPLLWSAPLFAAGTGVTLLQASRAGVLARLHPEPGWKACRTCLQILVAFLHLVQPAARLVGRVQHGLGPWNWRGYVRATPLPATVSIWTQVWEPSEARLSKLQAILEESGAVVVPGGDFDRWDFSIRGGLFGSIRVVTMVEEHGSGRQLCRLRAWPTPPVLSITTLAVLAILAGLALRDEAWISATLLGSTACALACLIYADCAEAMALWLGSLRRYLRQNPVMQVMDEDSRRWWRCSRKRRNRLRRGAVSAGQS